MDLYLHIEFQLHKDDCIVDSDLFSGDFGGVFVSILLCTGIFVAEKCTVKNER